MLQFTTSTFWAKVPIQQVLVCVCVRVGGGGEDLTPLSYSYI